MFVHTVLVATSFVLTTPAPGAHVDVSKNNGPTYYPYAIPRSQQQPDTGKKEPKQKPPPPPPKPPKTQPKPPPPKQNPPPPKGQPELRRRKPN
jgi:hypothetical protein